MPASTLTTLFAGLVTGLLSGIAAIVILAEAMLYAGVSGPAPDIFSKGNWTETVAHRDWFAPS